jgi:hypothetical protein
MSYTDRFARLVFRGASGCVGQTRVLFYRQSVHVRPSKHGRTFSVTKDTDYAGLADPVKDLVTEFLQLRRRKGRCFNFLKTQFRIGVELFINLLLSARGFVEAA